MYHYILIAVVGLATSACLAAGAAATASGAPRALAIDHEPQLVVDDYLVDNRWGLREPVETITRVAHRPVKHPGNPVIAGDGGYVNVVRDELTGRFRMWYQAYWDQSMNPRRYTYATAYAESDDGINWKLPRFGKYEFKGTRDNNIVYFGPSEGGAECQFLLNVPENQHRGYRYVMLYATYERDSRGMHLIGSQDGITWDPASDVRIAPDFVPDTQNSIVWEPRRREQRRARRLGARARRRGAGALREVRRHVQRPPPGQRDGDLRRRRHARADAHDL